MDKELQNKIDDGLIEFKKANYHLAIKKFNQLLEKSDNFLIYWYLGHSYFRIYDYQKAIENIEISIKIKSADQLNLNFLGEIYAQINNFDKSLSLFKKADALDKNNLVTLKNIANLLMSIGRIKEAKDYFDKIINIAPTDFYSHYQLVKIEKNHLSDELKDLINNNLKNNELDHLNKIYLHLLISEIKKNEKEYVEEINNLIFVHEEYLKIRQIAAKQEFEYYYKLLPTFVQKCKKINFKSILNSKPIFIFGLPRSGTTLVETIISNGYTNCKSAEESGFFDQSFFSENIINDFLQDKLSFNQELIIRLSNKISYQYNQIGIDINKDKFTDKSLENIFYFDLIKKIFIKSKFIYCKRDKEANFLGILRSFLPNLLWTHSVEKINVFMNMYENKLQEILKNNSSDILVVKLEELSNNPENEFKKIFSFLDIEWSNNFLNLSLKNNKKIFKTFSSVQAQKEIQPHDLSYIKNYKKILEKLIQNI